MNISDRTKVLFGAGATAAGVGDVIGASVDMQAYDCVRFLAVLGDAAAGAVVGLKLQTGTLADNSDMADVAGAATAAFTADATSADNKILSLDVVQPQKRYARCVLTRAASSVAVNALVTEVYDGHNVPAGLGDQVARRVVRG